MAIKDLYDIVEICISTGNDNIYVYSHSKDFEIPSGEGNVAYHVAKSFKEIYNVHNVDIYINVVKGIPPGYGLGSSGATSAATAFGLSKLLQPSLSDIEILRIAGIGEKFASGSMHYDNVAASLFGGIIILDLSRERVYRVIPKSEIYVAIVIPKSVLLPERKTAYARSILPKSIDLHIHVLQSSVIAKMIYALAIDNIDLFGEAISTDYIIEPIRSRLIPFYSEMKKIALENGALGFNISGAGPSVFSIHKSRDNAENVSKKLIEFLNSRGIETSFFVTQISDKGSEVIKQWR